MQAGVACAPCTTARIGNSIECVVGTSLNSERCLAVLHLTYVSHAVLAGCPLIHAPLTCMQAEPREVRAASLMQVLLALPSPTPASSAESAEASVSSDHMHSQLCRPNQRALSNKCMHAVLMECREGMLKAAARFALRVNGGSVSMHAVLMECMEGTLKAAARAASRATRPWAAPPAGAAPAAARGTAPRRRRS